MASRREFLKKLGFGVAGAAVAGKVIAKKGPKTEMLKKYEEHLATKPVDPLVGVPNEMYNGTAGYLTDGDFVTSSHLGTP